MKDVMIPFKTARDALSGEIVTMERHLQNGDEQNPDDMRDFADDLLRMSQKFDVMIAEGVRLIGEEAELWEDSRSEYVISEFCHTVRRNAAVIEEDAQEQRIMDRQYRSGHVRPYVEVD